MARRPRENAVIFGLDAYLVTISAMYSGSELDTKSTRIKLIGLAVGHFMQMCFYCNPLIFLSQCCKCTPYDDRAGVQSRGSLLKMGPVVSSFSVIFNRKMQKLPPFSNKGK